MINTDSKKAKPFRLKGIRNILYKLILILLVLSYFGHEISDRLIRQPINFWQERTFFEKSLLIFFTLVLVLEIVKIIGRLRGVKKAKGNGGNEEPVDFIEQKDVLGLEKPGTDKE